MCVREKFLGVRGVVSSEEKKKYLNPGGRQEVVERGKDAEYIGLSRGVV